MELLPAEIVVFIFRYIHPRELLRNRLISKKYKHILENNLLDMGLLSGRRPIQATDVDPKVKYIGKRPIMIDYGYLVRAINSVMDRFPLNERYNIRYKSGPETFLCIGNGEITRGIVCVSSADQSVMCTNIYNLSGSSERISQNIASGIRIIDRKYIPSENIPDDKHFLSHINQIRSILVCSYLKKIGEMGYKFVSLEVMKHIRRSTTSISKNVSQSVGRIHSSKAVYFIESKHNVYDMIDTLKKYPLHDGMVDGLWKHIDMPFGIKCYRSNPGFPFEIPNALTSIAEGDEIFCKMFNKKTKSIRKHIENASDIDLVKTIKSWKSSRGSDVYTLSQLKDICSIAGCSKTGTKREIVLRILKTIYTFPDTTRIDLDSSKARLLYVAMKSGKCSDDFIAKTLGET